MIPFTQCPLSPSPGGDHPVWRLRVQHGHLNPGPVAVVHLPGVRGAGVGPAHHHPPLQAHAQDVHVGLGAPGGHDAGGPGRRVHGGGRILGVALPGAQEDGTDTVDTGAHAAADAGKYLFVRLPFGLWVLFLRVIWVSGFRGETLPNPV